MSRLIRGLCRLGLGLAALGLLACLGLISYAVIMRYFFNRPPVWVDETAGYLLVGVVMLAAGDALLKGEHLAVDVLTERLPAGPKRWVAIAGAVAMAVTSIFLITEGWTMVDFSLLTGLMSAGSLSMPLAVPQSLVPIGGGLMLLAALLVLGRLLAGRAGFDGSDLHSTGAPKSGIE